MKKFFVSVAAALAIGTAFAASQVRPVAASSRFLPYLRAILRPT
ncbi:hypothetical protein CFL1_01444 [Lactobacillus delbrueckii subsp. bulgaricus]|nr:hypothetical protein [Lactobacillus delbrueckii]CUS17316.1 hypothetical protein CFL1_01444 [Lactobacillus delbrueckii subsp. bulgaricus]